MHSALFSSGGVVGVMVWPSGVEGFAVDCPRGFELVFECKGWEVQCVMEAEEGVVVVVQG